MFHFPRIDRIQAAKIVSMMIETDVDDLQDEAAVEHEMQINRPGFKQVSRDDLRELRKRFIQVADEFDFPEPLSKNKAPVFDRRAARIFETFQVLEPVEAAEPLVQNFIALVLLPDIVKWRWPNREKIGNYARWVGGPRNAIYTIYRQWEVLGETLTEDIIQDQMVGILERPSLSSIPAIARAMVTALDENMKTHGITNRQDLARTCAIRLRKRVPLEVFEAFPDDALQAVIREVFEEGTRAYLAANH